MNRRIPCLLVLAIASACGSRAPQTHYYALAQPAPAPARADGEAVLVVEELRADAGYDDPRIVYRESPYRLDYYHYHRWSAAPGPLLADYLRNAYASTGLFREVTSQAPAADAVILSGRILAIEEVDVTKDRWVGRLVLELQLHDAATGDLLWTRTIREEEPLPKQHPEGLAAAISRALSRVVRQTAPQIAGVAEARLRQASEPTGSL